VGAHALDTLDVHPQRGASWESFVIEHMASCLRQVAPASELFYWRTAAGAEVDLVVQQGHSVLPFEIKTHTSPGREDVKGLLIFMREHGLRHGYVIARCREDHSLGENVTVLSAHQIFAQATRLAELPGFAC
jgi:hypothetical protein